MKLRATTNANGKQVSSRRTPLRDRGAFESRDARAASFFFLTERIKWSSCVFQHSRRPLNHKHVSGESHDWRIAVAPSETFDTALAAAANRVKHSMLEVALCL